MYLTRIILSNIRLFDDLDISFSSASGKPLSWTVFVGDNATGKSTLLRSIAVGLCDESSAAGLVRELKGGLTRRSDDQQDGVIRVELLSSSGETWTVETTLHRVERTGEHVSQKLYRAPLDELTKETEIEFDSFPWGELFVVGYGAGRDIQGGEDYEEYRNIDAAYTLFRYDEALQGPELVWRRLLAQAAEDPETSKEVLDKRIQDLLHEVLLLDESESIELTSTGIHISRPDFSVSLSDHADGHKATTTWVLDLVSWRMLFDKRHLEPETMSGIVLLDELEQHLHPRWQRELLLKLHRQFPKMQFITTTHSPLCAGGTADLGEDECQLIALAREGGGVQRKPLSLPKGLRADQLLTSEAFGLPSTVPVLTEAELEEYRQLLLDPDADPDKVEALRSRLTDSIPGAAETVEDRQLEHDLLKAIDELRERIDAADGGK